MAFEDGEGVDGDIYDSLCSGVDEMRHDDMPMFDIIVYRIVLRCRFAKDATRPGTNVGVCR
jgi:hypothetical protein